MRPLQCLLLQHKAAVRMTYALWHAFTRITCLRWPHTTCASRPQMGRTPLDVLAPDASSESRELLQARFANRGSASVACVVQSSAASRLYAV